MKKLVTFAAVASVLFVAVAIAVIFTGADLPGFAALVGNGLMVAPAVPVVTLRAQLDQVTRDAEAKIASIKDTMTPEEIRAIEDEHRGLLEQAAQLRADIDVAVEAENNDRNTRTVSAADAADILDIGTRAGIPNDEIQKAIREGVTVADFRARAFDHLAERSNRTPTNPARILRDEAETRRSGLTEALAIRLGAPEPEGGPSEAARDFMDMVDVVEFASRALNHNGRLVTVRQREELLSRAFHTASDFPAIFSDAINTSLERRYALANPSYREISRRRDFMDFRPHHAVGIGEFPMLKALTEAGEIQFGTFGEGKETIAVVPYARGIRVSRQMLVNDRLGAIAELMAGYGRTVSRFEEITFYAMMASANTKLSDGKVVFHADHANLAGAGAAITTTSLSTGKAAMRKQKGLDDAALNITPRILLVSPDKEDEALQYLAPVVASEALKVNIHVGTLRPVVSAELSGKAWYLFADPEDAAVYQWGYLDGYAAPRVRFDEPFGAQGIGMTVEHDFGVGAVGFAGGYKNPGA